MKGDSYEIQKIEYEEVLDKLNRRDIMYSMM